MRAVWIHLIPYCAKDFVDFENQVWECTNNTVEVGHELGFNELDSERWLDNETNLNIPDD